MTRNRVPEPKVPCYCHRCSGVLVAARTFRKHRKEQRLAATGRAATENLPTPNNAVNPVAAVSDQEDDHEAGSGQDGDDGYLAGEDDEDIPDEEVAAAGRAVDETGSSEEDVQGPDGDFEMGEEGLLPRRDEIQEYFEDEIPDPLAIDGLEYREEEDSSEQEQEPDTPSDSSDEEDNSSIESIRIAQQFIAEISSATYASCKLDPATLERLENPIHDISALDDPDTRLSLKLFLSTSKMSQETYDDVRKAVMERCPDVKILSYYLVKKLAANITGITSISDDMCVNSCLAFTGPFAALDCCPTCNEARFDARGRPRKETCTIPLGPQIQALRVSPDGAQAMRYRDSKTAEIIEELNSSENPLYDDIFCGTDFLDLHKKLDLTEDDTTVALSIDGAQIYQNKKSDTWVAIWIVFDYDPKTRYRKKRCLPAAIIPGPNKPKNIDSFLFRSIQHLSALQRANNKKGLRVYDALKDKVIFSRIIFLLGTADAVGLTELDGRVGHHGTLGCRVGCGMKGRHKSNSGHYCAAHLRPADGDPSKNRDNYHPDYDFRTPGAVGSNCDTPETYKAKLALLSGSPDAAAYQKNRKKTGLSKPSILSGLVAEYMLRVPTCFTLDIMHLFFLNLGDLFIKHWRGDMRCDPPDTKANWDWAVLTGDTWIQHGKLVVDATKYFPSSFHRPPRNPVEKINSGYKATEYYLYVFGLGVGFFRPLLPYKYWKNFCKLVHGVRTIVQRSVTEAQLANAHSLLGEFVEEYELLYYQRRTDRLHFCRPAIHTLLHCCAETLRVGTLAAVSQYTLEGIIGILVAGIRLPSAIFANLIQIAIRQAQMSALTSMCPDLEKQKKLPEFCHPIGDGSALLQPRTRYAVGLEGPEKDAVRTLGGGLEKLRKWGRLLLSNGQIARSCFAENQRSSENKRNSRNVKIKLDNAYNYAEVQFYFLREVAESGELESFAMVSQYSEPNQDLLQDSYNTLWVCSYLGHRNLKVIPTSAIVSVVSMQPLPKRPEDGEGDLWFVVEKSGLDDMDIEGRLGADNVD